MHAKKATFTKFFLLLVRRKGIKTIQCTVYMNPKQPLLIHLINAARACTPLAWKQESPPTIQMWLSKVVETHRMDDFTVTLYQRVGKF